MVATRRRFKLRSQQAFTYSGRPLTPRTEGLVLSRRIPNLVARKTLSRMPRIAWPTSTSLSPAVNVGGVQKRDAQLNRTVNRSRRFRIVPRSVEFGHPHTAQT